MLMTVSAPERNTMATNCSGQMHAKYSPEKRRVAMKAPVKVARICSVKLTSATIFGERKSDKHQCYG